MRQSTCRQQERTGHVMTTVSSEQGPATCHDLVRHSTFFLTHLFRILERGGNGHIANSHSHIALAQKIVPVIDVSP
jgi:hypothetical protein